MTETTEDLLARLDRLMTTMHNDDVSAVKTEGRRRFIERIGIISDVRDVIAAAPDLHRIATEQAAEIARLREAIVPLLKFASEYSGSPKHLRMLSRARAALQVQP